MTRRHIDGVNVAVVGPSSGLPKPPRPAVACPPYGRLPSPSRAVAASLVHNAASRWEGRVGKGRVEAFSDGVVAILITIMVLELRPPEGTTLESLRPLTPVFLSYVLSFVNLGIYWSNHHHLLQAARVVDGRVLWANLHLLFWLSLLPFATAWMGQNPFAPLPTAAYGLDLLFAAIAYTILVWALETTRDQAPTLREAMGDDRKGRLSLLGYLVAVAVSPVLPIVAVAIYAAIAIVWFVPDRRIERTMSS